VKSIEDPSDSDYGSRVLAAFRKRGLPTSQWNEYTIDAIGKASRLEFLALFKQHHTPRHTSYHLIELIRGAAPEALVDRLAIDKKAQEQFEAMIPSIFTTFIP
jgi:hypothetical protein